MLMGSFEVGTVREEETGEEKPKRGEMSVAAEKNLEVEKRRKKKRMRYFPLPRFGCMKLDDDVSVEETPGGGGSFDLEAVDGEGKGRLPSHLVVTVNGIIGSAVDWKYAATLFVRVFPADIIVHCSESNSSMLTFDGVDVMGARLASEVISVVSNHPNLQKISFLCHSLGGLIARYAVAKLYQQDSMRKSAEENEEYSMNESQRSSIEEKPRAKICGLEPMNFITVATPHLGARGHKQVPVFCGFYAMEIFATRTSWLLGRTGKHLFLTDCEDGQPPLLLRMSSDSEDLMFISALQSFKRRVAYANIRFDQLVGWSSSSLRRRSELPKRRGLVRNARYPHIVNEEQSNMVHGLEEASSAIRVPRRRTYDMEETMIKGLTRLNWERVDVKFNGSMQRFLAHNTILVKTYCINSQGTDVIQHMVDKFEL